MDIALYISDLLQQHDEISVSGLGTFYKKRVAGYYDGQQDSYVPPAQRIEYKSEPYPDTRLAEYVTGQKHISLGSSEHFIEKFAQDIHNRLNAEQTAEIHPLGVFYKTNNEYSFIAADNRDPSSFGFKPVKEIRKTTISDPAILNSLPDIQAPEEEIAEDEPGKKRKFPVLIVILLILASGIAGIYFFSPDTMKRLTQPQEKPQNNKAVIPVEKPETLSDSITIADSIIQSLGDQGFEVDKAQDTLKVSAKATSANTDTTYEVIGASLNSQKDAETIVTNFKGKGIDARIIHAADKKRNNILISLGSFNTKSSAGKELVRIKKDIEPGAYIYTYNKK